METDDKPEAVEAKPAEPNTEEKPTESKAAGEEKKPEESKAAGEEKKPESTGEEMKPEDKKSEEQAKDDAKEVKKPETYFVEHKTSPRKKFEGARNDIKNKSIELRPELMKFPGARRIHCTEASKDPKAHAVVIRIEKTEEFKLPEEFGDIMKLDKEATEAKKSEKGFVGVYEMNDKSCKIWVKEFDAGKIKSLRAPKKINPLVEAGRMKNSKEPTKFDEDATEAEANAIPDAKPTTTEVKPSESTEPKPAEAKPAEPAETKPAEPEMKPADAKPAAESAGNADTEMKDATEETVDKPEKRPRDEASDEAPPAKKAKVTEEAKPSDAAAAAAIC